ncbi:alpha/beta hydrolase [Streptomyces sp. NPDC002623]
MSAINKTVHLEVDVERTTFQSQGLVCGATVFRPRGVTRPPVVVVGQGFGATRDMRIPDYAQAFAEAGMAVVTFDYRCWGDSEGEPRQYINAKWQLADWKSAIAYARTLIDLDTSRLALWGTAFSAGHVLVTAAEDLTVSAIVAQGPLGSGARAVLRQPPLHALKLTGHAIRDVISAKLLGRRHNVRIAGEFGKGACAVASTPDALPGEIQLFGGDAEAYEQMNFCPAEIALTFGMYRPLSKVRKINCPALIIGMEEDMLFHPFGGKIAASRMSDAVYVGYPIGHYGPYFDAFDDIVARTVDFLTDKLGVGATRA